MNDAARPPGPRRLSLLALSATTFFIVSGGPYGLEEIVQGHGYARTVLLLSLLPIVWSLPVALMVGELASTLPDEGGYYAWVRRALGPFWGVQEAWLSLAYGLFDMAIYPTLFLAYVSAAFPKLHDTGFGRPGWWVGVGMIAICAIWNLRGVHGVGAGSTAMSVALLLPFGILFILAIGRVCTGSMPVVRAAFGEAAPSSGGSAVAGGLMLAMWNYMGWDNASTVANEVESPQHTYPRAMLGTLGIVAIAYVGSIVAASASGLAPASWETGAWVEVARRLGGGRLGAALGWAVVLGGAISAFGMFNALLCSASRLPVALADDGWLPAAVAKRHPVTGAPVLAIVLMSITYACCLTLGIRRLVEIDVALYGTALILEFVALVVLRVREPALARPFRVPFGMWGAIAIGVPPTALLVYALWIGRAEMAVWKLTSLQLSLVIAGLGPILYVFRRKRVAAASAAT